jgi:release factor glutamine methyltransferase
MAAGLETAGGVLASAAARMAQAEIDTARLDATLLLAEALCLTGDAVRQVRDRPLTRDEAERYEALVARRLAREPVSRILGRRGFWSHDFALSASTLDPRPDSEAVIEAVLAAIQDPAAPLRLLDLGTGTGCLLLSLLSELPNAIGVGTDIARGAVETARRNAAGIGLADRASFVESNWFDGVSGRFDIILSNPPYIPTGTIDRLEPEVRVFDPVVALDGGADGLDAYRALVGGAPGHLAPAGVLALEIGFDQAAAVTQLLAAAGFSHPVIGHDLGGRDRVLTARMPAVMESGGAAQNA